MGQDVYIYGIHTYHIYKYINRQIFVLLTSVGLAVLAPNILGECSALWGEREGVVRCIIVFHSTTFSHLHTSHITIASFLGLPHLQL